MGSSGNRPPVTSSFVRCFLDLFLNNLDLCYRENNGFLFKIATFQECRLKSTVSISLDFPSMMSLVDGFLNYPQSFFSSILSETLV